MNTCNFSLSLGLGLSISNTDSISFDTCLSLGPTMDTSPRQLTIDVNKTAVDDSYEFTSSQSQSAASYLSSGSGKRDRDHTGGDEIEVEKMNYNRVSDEDEDGGSCRKKLRLTKEQSSLLEHSFKTHSTLNPKQKQVLARELNLRPRQVEVWFQNRRARTKLKQTEMDCELLKKCCEALRGENRSLIKELQELKAVKLAQPLYMRLPAATLTMCPSCERVGGSAVESVASQKTPFSMPKPHLGIFRYFPNSSAAC